MGLNPQVWGKNAWHFIHYVALAYPDNPTEQDKLEYRKFLESLQTVLPCAICAANFRKKMETYPPNLDNRQSFFEWTVDIHNKVNEYNHKSILSYDEAMAELKKKDTRISDLTTAVALSIASAALIVLLAKKLSK